MTRRVTATLVLATFIAALVLPSLVVSHACADPDLGGADGLFAGHPITQFEGVRAAVLPEHCALCHWLRSLGSSANELPAALPVPAPAAGPCDPGDDAAWVTATIRGPARAPPASFTA